MQTAGGRVLTRTWLVRALTGLGAFEESIAHGEEAVRRAAADDDPYALTQAQAFLGLLLVARGDLARAIPLLEQRSDWRAPRTSPTPSRARPSPWARLTHSAGALRRVRRCSSRSWRTTCAVASRTRPA
jgi:hypothetical protein